LKNAFTFLTVIHKSYVTEAKEMDW